MCKLHVARSGISAAHSTLCAALLQVLYVLDNPATTKRLRQHAVNSRKLCDPFTHATDHEKRDEERLVKERQPKWQQHAAQLIEFFSSLGVLVEVAAERSLGAAAADDHQPSLAAIGYAAGAAISSAGQEAHVSSSSGSSMWLQQAGWCCSSTRRLRAIPAARLPRHSSDVYSITATPIEPVVSQRLATSRTECGAVLQYAASCTGLLSGSSSSSSFAGLMPVPSQAVTAASDAHWLAVPGRYCVSLKLDGTRHLLIATDSGCYLLNRAGMMYKYSVAAAAVQAEGSSNASTDSSSSSITCRVTQEAAGTTNQHCSSSDDSTDNISSTAPAAACSTTESNSSSSGATPQSAAAAPACSAAAVPPGTVLDGELLWASSGAEDSKCGYFVAFDALCVAGNKVWQLPLQQRLAQMQRQLALPEVETIANSCSAHGPNAETAAPGQHPVAATTTTASSSSNSDSSAAGISSSHSTTPSVSVNSHQHTPSAAAAAGEGNAPISNTDSSNSSSTPPPLTLVKKQQAAPAGSDAITLLFKPHLSVSAAALQQLQVSAAAYPFSTDGLVFTPAAMPYVLGMRQLLLKWQPLQQAAADIRGEELKKLLPNIRSYKYEFERLPGGRAFIDRMEATWKSVQQLPGSLVYECIQLLPAADNPPEPSQPQQAGRRAAPRAARSIQQTISTLKWRLWQPMSVRWDKAIGNSSAVRAQLEQWSLPGSDKARLTLDQLIDAVWEVESHVTTAAEKPAATGSILSTACSSSSTSSACTSNPSGADSSSSIASSRATAAALHPARSMPFDQLYAAVQAEVAAGNVRCITDPDSGLEVFCYDMNIGPPSSSSAAMCRGLVLHPASSSVVATPFARFGGPGSVPAVHSVLAAAAVERSSTSSSSSTRNVGQNNSRGGRRGRSNTRGKGAGRSSITAVLQEQPASAAASTSSSGGLQLYQQWGEAPFASASVKVDGSFVLAFMWQGNLCTATRRRMDSEQVCFTCVTWPASSISSVINSRQAA
jgi:transcriptional regulator of met regulon